MDVLDEEPSGDEDDEGEDDEDEDFDEDEDEDEDEEIESEDDDEAPDAVPLKGDKVRGACSTRLCDGRVAQIGGGSVTRRCR